MILLWLLQTKKLILKNHSCNPKSRNTSFHPDSHLPDLYGIPQLIRVFFTLLDLHLFLVYNISMLPTLHNSKVICSTAAAITILLYFNCVMRKFLCWVKTLLILLAFADGCARVKVGYCADSSTDNFFYFWTDLNETYIMKNLARSLLVCAFFIKIRHQILANRNTLMKPLFWVLLAS